MKHCALTFIILMALGNPVYTQITLTNVTFPQAGDTLYTRVDNMPTGVAVGTPGVNQSWNFTTLQSPFIRLAAVRAASEGNAAASFPSAEIVTSIGQDAEAYYNVDGDSYDLLGFFGSDPLNFGITDVIKFSTPLVEQRAPVSYLDESDTSTSLSYAFSADDVPVSILDSLPITPDSFRVRIAIERMDLVDAWGKLTIPGGVYDVLREKRTQNQSIRIDTKVAILGWQDVTDLLIQLAGLEGVIGNITTVQYVFRSNESKEPIALVTMDQNEQNPVSVEYKAVDVASNVQSVENLKPGVYAYPNPAIVSTRFEFSNLPPGRYQLKLYNILGMLVWEQDYYINGLRTEKVDLSNLKKGTYLYSLVNARGRTLTTKRLIIIRP